MSATWARWSGKKVIVHALVELFAERCQRHRRCSPQPVVHRPDFHAALTHQYIVDILGTRAIEIGRTKPMLEHDNGLVPLQQRRCATQYLQHGAFDIDLHEVDLPAGVDYVVQATHPDPDPRVGLGGPVVAASAKTAVGRIRDDVVELRFAGLVAERDLVNLDTGAGEFLPE